MKEFNFLTVIDGHHRIITKNNMRCYGFIVLPEKDREDEWCCSGLIEGKKFTFNKQGECKEDKKLNLFLGEEYAPEIEP